MKSRAFSHLQIAFCVSLFLSGCSGGPDGSVSSKPTIEEAAQPLAPYTVNLAIFPQPNLNPGGLAHVVATANQDVGPTPYWIEIYDNSTGLFLHRCGFGSTCAFDAFSTSPSFRNFVAYISSYGTSFPPPNVQATSSVATAIWGNGGISLSVTATPNPVTFPRGVRFSATSNKALEGSSLSILLWEDPDEESVNSCNATTSCSGFYAPSSRPFAAFTAAVCEKPIDFSTTITDCAPIITQSSVAVTVK
jgi:hypothetical protein